VVRLPESGPGEGEIGEKGRIDRRRREGEIGKLPVSCTLEKPS
jgi:hypothetical protein